MRDLATARRRKGGVVRGRRSAISKERNETLRNHPRPPPATPFSLRPICPYHMLRPGKQLCDCGQGGRGRDRPRSVGLSCARVLARAPTPPRQRVWLARALKVLQQPTARWIRRRQPCAGGFLQRSAWTASARHAIRFPLGERLAAAQQCAAQQLTARTAERAGARRMGLQAGLRLGFALCLRRAWRRTCRCC